MEPSKKTPRSGPLPEEDADYLVKLCRARGSEGVAAELGVASDTLRRAAVGDNLAKATRRALTLQVERLRSAS